MKRRTILKTGIASMFAGLLPKTLLADTSKSLVTTRFTEAATGTKWLIKYIDGVGYKVFQKKRFLFKETPMDIQWLTVKMNSIGVKQDDFSDKVMIVLKEDADPNYKREFQKLHNRSQRWGEGAFDIDVIDVHTEYDNDYLKKDYDQRCTYLWEQTNNKERRATVRA